MKHLQHAVHRSRLEYSLDGMERGKTRYAACRHLCRFVLGRLRIWLLIGKGSWRLPAQK
jgi:hypothetical protein